MQSLEIYKNQMCSPQIIFDIDQIRRRCQSLQSFCQENRIELYFAVKACSELGLLSVIAPYVDGFDVSNGNEFVVVKSLGKPVSYYDPTGHSPPSGVKTIIAERPEFLPQDSPHIVRFNATELFPEKTKSRFGFSLAELSQVQNLEGVHIHLRELHEYSLEEFRSIIKKLRQIHPQLSFLNLGGGWHKLENSNDYQRILQSLRSENPYLRLRIEPGRFFTWNCGQVCGQIMSINRQRHELVTNISSYLHLNWSDPQLKIVTSEAVATLKVQIFGPTCFEFDQIGNYVVSQGWWESLKVGDTISFSGISSYTLQRQAEFNGHRKCTLNM